MGDMADNLIQSELGYLANDENRDVDFSSCKAVAKRFMWRDRGGSFHKIEGMETRHLFFTIRMIWNHSVPEEFRIHPFKRYHFSSFYTKEYLGKAVHFLSLELSKRNDLTGYYKRCLKHIHNCINSGALGKYRHKELQSSL